MAAKINWHRSRTKLRYCHPVYRMYRRCRQTQVSHSPLLSPHYCSAGPKIATAHNDNAEDGIRGTAVPQWGLGAELKHYC